MPIYKQILLLSFFLFQRQIFAFESFEHLWIGDSVHVQFNDDDFGRGKVYPYANLTQLVRYRASLVEINLPEISPSFITLTSKNGKNITYSFGEIMALSGDYIADPIGKVIAQNCAKGWNNACFVSSKAAIEKIIPYFYVGESNVFSIEKNIDILRRILKSELQDVSRYLESNSPIQSAILGGKGGISSIWKNIFSLYGKFPFYTNILASNDDHFAPEAKYVYLTAHTMALEQAQKSYKIKAKYPQEAKNLLSLAYLLEGFAAHFLTDLYSAGHIRTPTRLLRHLEGMAALNSGGLANAMHDEDGFWGLLVKNKNTSWESFGDASLFDTHGKNNMDQTFLAVQSSLDQVYLAATGKNFGLPSKIFDFIPILDVTQKNHSPLIKIGSAKDLHIRTNYYDVYSSSYSNFTNITGLLAFFHARLTKYSDSDFRTFLRTTDGKKIYAAKVYCYTLYERKPFGKTEYVSLPYTIDLRHVGPIHSFPNAIGYANRASFWVASQKAGEEIKKGCSILTDNKVVEIRARYYTLGNPDQSVAIYDEKGQIHRLLGKGYDYFSSQQGKLTEDIAHYDVYSSMHLPVNDEPEALIKGQIETTETDSL